MRVVLESELGLGLPQFHSVLRIHKVTLYYNHPSFRLLTINISLIEGEVKLEMYVQVVSIFFLG